MLMSRPKSNKNRVTTSLKINPDLWRKIKSRAALKGIELSELMEQLIERELERELISAEKIGEQK